jgi:carbonic anhydrase
VGVIDDLLANNRALAARYDCGHLDVRPSLRLAIVTCMGSRLDVFAALGPEDGPSGVTSSVTTPRALRRMCAYGSRSRSAGSVRRRGLVYDVDTGVLREIEA